MKRPKQERGKISTLVAAGLYFLLAVWWIFYIVRYVNRWEFSSETETFLLCLLAAVLIVLLLAISVLCFIRYMRGEDQGSIWNWLKTMSKIAKGRKKEEICGNGSEETRTEKVE